MKARDNSAQHKRMSEEPVARLVTSLAIPSTITMLITSLYNIADTFFVSQLGASATGAVGVIFSLMSIIQAVGFMLGMGCNSLVSRHLGAREQQKADITASVGFFSALTFGLLLMTVGTLFRRELVFLLGATETVAELAEIYATYILYAAPLMCTCFLMNNVLRGEGKAMLGTIAMTVGGVLNMGMDPLFIFGFNMGIAGAGLATALSQTASFCILFYMYASGRSSIQIRLKNVAGNLRVLPRIVSVGWPSMCRQGLASLSSVLLNRTVREYGDTALAAMSIVSRVSHFQGSVMRGLGQGCQPVVGYNFGAKNYQRVKETMRFTCWACTGFMLVVCAVMFVLAPEVIALFRGNDPDLVEIGSFALRVNCLAMPLGGLFTTVSMGQQSMGQSGRSAFVSACRQGVFFIPLVLVLPGILGLKGAQLAQPIADVLTFSVALYFHRKLMRELTERIQKLPDPQLS